MPGLAKVELLADLCASQPLAGVEIGADPTRRVSRGECVAASASRLQAIDELDRVARAASSRTEELKRHRDPVETRSMKRVGAILLLIMVAAGAGVAGSYLAFGRSETTTAVTTVDQTRTVTRTSKAARPADDEVPAQYRDLGSCYAFDRGSDLAINFIASDAGAACWKLAQANARNGDYWSVSEKAPTSVSPQQQPYCTMQYKGGGQAYVYDTGGAFGGQRVCASLVAHGWTETSGDI